jgi:hypothetical protein
VSEAFPEHLLDETLWDFAGQPAFPSRTEFVAAVLLHHREAQEYAPDIRPEESWRPDHIALRCPRIVVRYYCDPPGEKPSWRETELASDDGSSFTDGELLYKLHNAIIEEVRDNGHRWFEGLEFEGLARAGIPVYRLIPGS